MSMRPNVPGESGSLPPELSLNLNLSSNNPFRKGAASPAIPSPNVASPRSPFDDPPPRPQSRNPFLDPNGRPLPSPDIMSTTKSEPTAEELFDGLNLHEKRPTPPPGPGQRPPRPNGPPGRPPMGRGPGSASGPSRGRGPPPDSQRRSQEDAMRSRKPGMRGPPSKQGSGSGRSPPRRSRPRRNSDSSIMGHEKPMTDEEKKIRDIRRREHERRHRDKSSRSKDAPPRPNRKLDIIDQLDATSIYGMGLFHHDGPFDALNPHRNRTGSRRAPMQAFPEGSLNNTLGGSGPVNKRPDHAAFMGNNDVEAFHDYGVNDAPTGYLPPRPSDPNLKSGAAPVVVDPTSRGDVVFGDESLGLGASTFLEGTPATRTAIQRREAETQQETADMGLQRKKSLAQRVLNRVPTQPGRMPSVEGSYGRSHRSPPDMMPSGSMNPNHEGNPFSNEFDRSNEQKISVRKPSDGSVKSPSSPKRSFGIERRSTADAAVEGEGQKTGILARVKSLKGGRRQRPERPAEPSPAPPGNIDSFTGTAL